MASQTEHRVSRSAVAHRGFSSVIAAASIVSAVVAFAVFLAAPDKQTPAKASANAPAKQASAARDTARPMAAQSPAASDVAPSSATTNTIDPPQVRPPKAQAAGAAGDGNGNVSGFAPPPNDSCTSCTPLATGQPVTGSTLGATGTGRSSCGGTDIIRDNLDVWFCWTPQCGGIGSISLCGSQFDTTLAVYDGCALTHAPTELACDDDGCTLPFAGPSRLTMQVNAGQTYYIRVAGYNGAVGSYTLVAGLDCTGCVTCPTGSLAEGELNCGFPRDTTNGGCKTPPGIPPQFTRTDCGITYCGTAASNADLHDSDWYQVAVTTPTAFTWTVDAAFAATIGLVETNPPGAGNCANQTGNLNPTANISACTTGSVTTCVPPGMYWFLVAPQFPGPPVPCGSEYSASLTCAPCVLSQACCVPDGRCVDTDPRICELEFHGISQGPGTSCATAVCPLPTGACCAPPQACTSSGPCGPLPRCGGSFNCFCFDTAEGGLDCSNDFLCSTAAPCPNGTPNCPTGQVCYVDTCCGSPICAPLGCGRTTAEANAPVGDVGLLGGLTASGAPPLNVAAAGACIQVDKPTCLAQGGLYQGDLTQCSLVACPQPLEACCYGAGGCADLVGTDCVNSGGSPQGPGTSCATVHCPLPTGACCADGCFITDRATCNSVGGPYLGDGTVCTGPLCQPNTPCQDCGPGPHWIDQCQGGGDFVPTGALVGISTDPSSCDPNVNLVLSGLVSISRSNPRDISNNFTGIGVLDGHLDVIDTEMLSMRLDGNGITLRAGAGTSIGAPIRPSFGAIVEQPGNPAVANSFFDVFVEIQMPGGGFLYNQQPLRVQADITCVPPDANYLHPVGCVKLFTSPIPERGLYVANLTSANHSTFPTCGDPGTGACNQPHDSPFCSDGQCCSRVCELHPNCCTQAWDATCVAAAELVCNPGACCLPTCANGGVCGQFQNCGSVGGTPCLCFSAAEGGGNCAADYPCTNPLCPNGTRDCPAGLICYVNTCCGQPICGPAGCVPTTAGAAPTSVDPNIGPTASGGQGTVSGEVSIPVPACIVTDPVRCAAQGGVYNGNGTACTPTTCAPPAVEVDHFPNTTALMELQMPNGQSVPIALSGPTTVKVYFEGPNEGDANDDDGNGLDEVKTEMVDMQLTGVSPFGPVLVTLNPNIPSLGQIEETANTQPGRLDLPPFAPTGTANSFFDVFFEIQVGGMHLHTAIPKRMSSVITHKPPAPGDTYENPEKIPLLDENGNPTGISIGAGRHTPRPPVEVDHFPNTSALMELQTPNGQSVPIALSGPTTVKVYFEGPNEGDANDDDGNGLDEVKTEMVDMQLTGVSPFGPVLVTLNPNIPSLGQIEETANTQPGRLDLPPFAPTGTANSFFDVFFDIQVGEMRFHTATAKRMSSVITHKPPAPGNVYENPEKTMLLDDNGNPTGFSIGAGRHVPRPPVEVDHFQSSVGQLELQFPDGVSELIQVIGPTTVNVFFEGPNEGDANDNDGNGLDEVQTEMVQLQLTGVSPRLGPFTVRLNPNIPSRGQIEETANTQPGRLDLPPFAPTGTANSFFDLYFAIDVGGQTYFTQNPKRMSSVITHKPPAPGDTYENVEKIPIFDANGNPTGLSLGAGSHVPRPQCGSPGTGDCSTPHNSPFCENGECCDKVCTLAPNCCATGWSTVCAGLAQQICAAPRACCLPNGRCKDLPEAVCELGGGTPRGAGSACRGDNNGNSIDDACECTGIVSSRPDNCAIDARQPHRPGNPAARQGWDSVALTFDAGCDVSGATPGDFTVSVTPPGTAPTVSSVSVAGQTVTVTLSSVIPAQKWTCVTHTATGKKVCLGSLPADVNGDRTSAPVDILEIIDNLNGVRVPPLQPYQCDIDRSNLCAPADILSEIDLLNGANGFLVWNGKSLPICPSAP